MSGPEVFDQPLKVKDEIPNETGPRPMRGYTPWRVEEVGKLHHDVEVRTMTDSEVRIDDILREVLDILTNLVLRSILIKVPNTTHSSQANGSRRLSYRLSTLYGGLLPSMR